MAAARYFGTPRRGLKRRNSNTDPYSPAWPSPTAGDGRFDGERIDLDGEASLGIYRCKQCGMPCDEDRVQNPGGTADGSAGIKVSVTSGVGDPTTSPAYCPLCSSPNSREVGEQPPPGI
jgi:hypothetical protein